MCLILFAIATHPKYPLLLAANRDEYYARPTRPLQAWPEAPQLYAGKDLEAGGTWFGITRSGRFAAVTNVREGIPRTSQQRSRGELTRDFLLSSSTAAEFAEFAQRHGEAYAGFNLLLGDGVDIYYCSNRGAEPQRLQPGIYGLSNDSLDTPWPKVESGKAALQQLVQQEPTPTQLLALLSDRHQPNDDELLRETDVSGGGLSLERVFASRFIASPHYGTRASTALLIDAQGEVDVWEQNYGSNGSIGPLLQYRWSFETEE